MKLQETNIKGVVILEPEVHGDHRGYFLESYNKSTLQKFELEYNFIQDNESFSSRGVLRGLHYQVGQYSQAKLVRVISGEVRDIVVDIREGSPTYGEHVSVNLSGENKRQLMIPRGIAHGFIVLSETATFCYKCDNVYNKNSEASISPLCPKLNLEWGIGEEDILLSDKDREGALFGEHTLSGISY